MATLSFDVKDSVARADLADLEAYVETITPVALSVDSNGIYTAPEGVFGYSPVTVNVPAYIDNNVGLSNPAGFGNTFECTPKKNGYFKLTPNQSITIECCANLELPSSATYGRIFQVGTNSICTLLAWNKATTNYAAFDCVVGAKWWSNKEDWEKIDLTPYLNALHTFSYVVGAEKTQLYIDGTLVIDNISFTNADILSESSNYTQVYILHGSVSSRTTNGSMYALRMYQRALTEAEMQNNATIDQALYGT